MEGSLSNGVFSEDYAHFEQNHADFPEEARSVFECVASLREALGEFRKATENKCVVDDARAIADVVVEDVQAEERSATEDVQSQAATDEERIVCEAVAEASLACDPPTEAASE
jgi:hypothetical protein